MQNWRPWAVALMTASFLGGIVAGFEHFVPLWVGMCMILVPAAIATVAAVVNLNRREKEWKDKIERERRSMDAITNERNLIFQQPRPMPKPLKREAGVYASSETIDYPTKRRESPLDDGYIATAVMVDTIFTERNDTANSEPSTSSSSFDSGSNDTGSFDFGGGDTGGGGAGGEY